MRISCLRCSGRPEYDVGVFLAHLFLGAQPIELWLALRARYQAPRGFQDRLVHQIAGGREIIAER